MVHPEIEGSQFHPLRLKSLLAWPQQQAMVREFEKAAVGKYDEKSLELQPWSASYYLFQCFLVGFGVTPDPERACYWLFKISTAEEETATTDYWAKAWLTRVSVTLMVDNPLTLEQQIDDLFMSVIRGHRHCLEDAKMVIAKSLSADQKVIWQRRMKDADRFFRGLSGTSMPYFAARKLSRPYKIQLGNEDISLVDAEIKEELGDEYISCLRSCSRSTMAPLIENPPAAGYRFDHIYVNYQGHGLLHLTATAGNLPALSHLVRKYQCNINLPNQSHGDSPLVCACRSGRFDCALFLLENGAFADGTEDGQESPLHWLSSFDKSEMIELARELIKHGAEIEKPTGEMNKSVRGILADWENCHGIHLTPLGRAVLMKSLPAVKILLQLGADPVLYSTGIQASAVELAAVLTFPDHLRLLLDHLDESLNGISSDVFDECWMLEAAHEERFTDGFDPLSLQSRLVRCGVGYKKDLSRTLQLLYKRRQRRQAAGIKYLEHAAGKHLYKEIALGNTDIIEALLDLGHDVNGSPKYWPIEAAVLENNIVIFQLLQKRGVILQSTIM
jgi:hypothetical protein